MKTCASCGHGNPDTTDFCGCGEYLRWEPTQVLAPARSRPAPDRELPSGRERRLLIPSDNPTLPPVGPAATPARATLWLRPPDAAAAGDNAATTSVAAGERTYLDGVVRNVSEIVDNYELWVRGLPTGWWTITPRAAYLVPYGTAGVYEQEFQVYVHPPRTPAAEARAWAFEVVAESRAHGAEAACAPASVRIEPFQKFAAKLEPDRASGRRRGRFVLTVHNRSNAPADLRLAAEDAEGGCRFRFADPAMTIEPGQGVAAPVTVRPPKQIWIGRAQERAIRVTATPMRGDQTPVTQAATYRQRAWLPWWLGLCVSLAAAVVAAVLLLLPKRVIVPNLKHATSVFAAEKLAVRAGLKLSPSVGQITTTHARPGVIIGQTPSAGTKVKRGSTVTIAVAIGTGLVKVPKVVGSTPVTADGTLRRAHLILGTVSPPPADPPPADPNGVIGVQIPEAGASVASGTAVNVYLKPPAAGGTGHRTTPSGGPVAVPALAGVTAAAAAQRLSQMGLVTVVVKQFSTQPAGALIGTQPASGSSLAQGTTVQLLVSVGYPKLAYDDGGSVHVIDGATGEPSGAGPPGSTADEPSWSPSGAELVFVRGAANSGQLMSFVPNQTGAQPQPLSTPGSDEHDPAISPNGAILAFIDRSQGSGRLCFAAANPFVTPLGTSNCQGNSGYDLGRQISWSPDGKHVLVFGSQIANGQIHGLIEYSTASPFSLNASAWDHGTMVTAPSQDVIAGAFSPDGKHVALVSDFGQPSFGVFLAPAGVFDVTKAQVLAASACQVSWRSDSQALAVTQPTTGCLPDSGDYPLGNIVTFNIDDPSAQTVVATAAENPSWQPVTLDG